MVLILLFQAAGVDFHFRVQESIRLEIETPAVDLGVIDPISKEMEKNSAIILTVYSNTDWQLMVQPENDFISTNGDVIPIERLDLRVNGGDYVKMERDGIFLMKGGATDEEGKVIDIDAKLKLRWKDAAGDYSTTLTFTVMKL